MWTGRSGGRGWRGWSPGRKAKIRTQGREYKDGDLRLSGGSRMQGVGSGDSARVPWGGDVGALGVKDTAGRGQRRVFCG